MSEIKIENNNGENKENKEGEEVKDYVETPVEDKDALIEKLQQEINDLQNKYLRSLADYDNLRKRTQREIEFRTSEIRRNFLAKILPNIDQLERALSYSDSENFKKGIEMVYKNLFEALKSENISKIDAEPGTIFNPLYHEVVFAEESDKPEGTILQELSAGYIYNNEVLIPSKVKVSRPPKKEGETLDEV
ncbi:Protein grpE [Thermodesulfobium narugense DSM 14796]|uniref:Protein GrpE n=1 Tax=Thermodesulfobium narugense DSM 14796 TaxID=747365 RepID=M1E8D6_9BACT|nr:nucleotide exchange factor GrpE [Thermodesulfobium narugense]AEE14414.1 Protein grpE [Thermodesulfobium narugense DSM 14796]